MLRFFAKPRLAMNLDPHFWDGFMSFRLSGPACIHRNRCYHGKKTNQTRRPGSRSRWQYFDNPCALRYVVVVKNVSIVKRFFLQPLIPQFGIGCFSTEGLHPITTAPIKKQSCLGDSKYLYARRCKFGDGIWTLSEPKSANLFQRR